MKTILYWSAACLLLAFSVQSRADEPLVDLAPIAVPGCDAGFCVAVPGDCAGGVCRRPVAAAVATAGRLPVAVVRRIADRLESRPLLRRVGDRIRSRPLLRRVFSPRCRSGGCRG